MLDEDSVQALIRSVYLDGERPPPPLTAVELRGMGGRSPSRARIGLKLPAALVAAALLVVVLFAATPLGRSAHTTPPAGRHPAGPVAYSAYGLQLTVPRSWSVSYFPPCPRSGLNGSLAIGAASVTYVCQGDVRTGPSVAMYAGPAPQAWTDAPQHVTINGINALKSGSAGSSLLYVPMARAFILARGPGSDGVVATLRRATPGAIKAPGIGLGTEYLEALQRMPVSGPVTVENTATGRTVTVPAVNGQFSFAGQPGRYRITGNAGNAPCPPLTVSLTSGRYSTWPSIQCQGE